MLKQLVSLWIILNIYNSFFLNIKINVERINNNTIGRYTYCMPIILAVYPKIGGAIIKSPYTAIVITVIPTAGLIFFIEEARV